MNNPSICFLGTGKINERHVHSVRRLIPGARLSVASRNGPRGESFKRRKGLDEAFAGYEAAMESAYSTIVVGVPPGLHHDLVESALNAGKHVLIEKPVFNSMDEFCDLWPRMVRHDGIVMVAENQHFAPFQRLLKTVLSSEDLGRPLFLDLVRRGRSSTTGWRADPAEMPLGALHEGGVHWIRRLLDLASVYDDESKGGVLGVRAYGPDTPLTPTPREDTSLVLARHRSGLVSRLFYSWAFPWRFPTFDMSRILLERGELYFDARGIFGRLYGKRKRFLWPCIRDWEGNLAMWKSFIRAIRGEAPPELTMETVFEDFAYMDAAYRSRSSGREEVPVSLNDISE